MGRFLFLALLIHGVSASTAQASPTINWQQWGTAAFQEATENNRMIILDVGIEGCTACRWMDELTYTDATVIDLINTYFVAIVADAEAQPDVGERYSDWAWPATIFMAPDGTQVLALAGNRSPKNFIPVLRELIDRQQKGQLDADRLAPYAASPQPETTDLTRLRDRVRKQLDSTLNEQHGGWSSKSVSTASGARLEHLYYRAHMYEDTELRAVALKTTDLYIRAMDPVWGGVFVAVFVDAQATPPRFQGLGAVPEKRISNQADAMSAFATAYQVTGDERYLRALEEVDRFITAWLMDEEGVFYTSQEDAPAGLPRDMTSIDYWRLESDAERRQYGIPPVDGAVYTDKNAQMIMAYTGAFEATGDTDYLQRAIRAAQYLIDNRWKEPGWMLQTSSSEVNHEQRMRPLVVEQKPFLSAQVWFTSAMLALYRATGNSIWLARADRLAGEMISKLYDHELGGFFATVPDEAAAIVAPRKPLEQNALAAQALYKLWVYTKDDRYAAIPERSLRAAATSGVLRREGKVVGETALALETLTAAYVEFSVVGQPLAASTIALFEAGRATYHPRKLLHYELAGRYPMRDRSAMYICNPDRCSLPIYDPGLVASQADFFRLPANFSH